MLTTWLPTIIAAGALGACWILIQRMTSRLENTFMSELKKVWDEVHDIKKDYLEEDKHRLICGKSALEIEKLFTKALKITEDNIFKKLRDIHKEINDKTQPS